MKKLSIILLALFALNSHARLDRTDVAQLPQNYVKNPGAELGLSFAGEYDDGAVSEPVDCSAGTSASSLTASSTGALAQRFSYNLTTTAADNQGEGFALDVHVEDADINGTVTLSADIDVDSSYVGGKVKVFLYDVDNAAFIDSRSTDIVNANPTIYGDGKINLTYDLNGADDYRVCFHVATTDTAATVLKVDNILMTGGAGITGPPATDWVSFTPTGSWTTNTTYTGQWRRNGDSIDLRYALALTGAPTSASLTLNLPTALTVDTNKVLNGDRIGQAHYFDNGVGHDLLYVRHVSGTLAVMEKGPGGDAVNATSPITWASGDELKVQIDGLPISNWSSNIALSNATEFLISHVLVNGSHVSGTPDALGEYRGLIKDSGTRTATVNAPTGGYLPTAADGMQINGSFNFASAGVSGQPNRWEIFVGKNKVVRPLWYSGTGRTGNVAVDSRTISTTHYGTSFEYDPTTGVAIIDAIDQDSTITTRLAGRKIATGGATEPLDSSTVYFDLVVSEKALAHGFDTNAGATIELHTGSGHGSTGTKVRTFSTIKTNDGRGAMELTQSGTNGDSVEILQKGVYSINYFDRRGTASTSAIGFGKNATRTTDVNSLSESTLLTYIISNLTGESIQVHWQGELNVGDVITPQTNAVPDDTSNSVRFIMTKID